MSDQPADRGICGADAPTLTPSTFGGVCTLLAGHTGWHHADSGTSWGMRAEAPNPAQRDLTQADVDAAYQRGIDHVLDQSEPLVAKLRAELEQLQALLAHRVEQHARGTQDELVFEAAEEAYQRGLTDGRARAVAAIRAADTSSWPGGRCSDVDECQERAAEIAEQPEGGAR